MHIQQKDGKFIVWADGSCEEFRSEVVAKEFMADLEYRRDHAGLCHGCGKPVSKLNWLTCGGKIHWYCRPCWNENCDAKYG